MFLHFILEEIIYGCLLYYPSLAYLGAYQEVGAFHSTRQNSYLGVYLGHYSNTCTCMLAT